MLNYDNDQHPCKSNPVFIPSVYLVPEKQMQNYQLEMTAIAKITPASWLSTWDKFFTGNDENEPIDLVFNADGSKVCTETH